ncbi:H-2 class I histocompatibility antigen, K-D alpha chain isoform X2 [Fundulus heteroclitus]|uniref:H-2 class I histocompatibility antigen, K-D alpha chain isoform X2 n=1 Tax=Fundulus heteroclitus TaxID=8078 RepID=UPI00165A7CB7|nr:H-2 class I histocompatibility antigen, K-D alpha chain isoform X2 [Fundulus heteroclitus]
MASIKTLMFLILLGIPGSTAGTHSLKYFYTASSGIANFPSYVSVGLVDDVQISYCDSDINRNIPKQEWMKKVESDHPRYWREETQTCLDKQKTFRENLDVAKHRFNQTEGAHIFQQMIGCEWEDETGDVSGYDQFGYDGEDFIILDLRTQTWIAPKQQAVITKNKWNNDRYAAEYEKSYLTQICVEWLKKYVNYGRSSLLRTDLPSVSFLQKNSRSPVSCHATGFYPNRAQMFWRKDGKEVHGGVVKGEILPNNDGTFQMSVDIDLSSVAPGDWNKYECVFQLSGVNDINRLGKSKIRSNELILPVTLSLKYFYTASSGIANFPSYVSVGLVDDVHISYCDSNIKKNTPKQEWMNEVKSEHPSYWKEETQTCLDKKETFRENLEIAKQRFNQTGGAHIFQQMIGCEWNGETGEVRGHDRFGYDGEDLIVLDPTTQTWIAPKQQAVITINKWNQNRYAAEYEKSYLTEICVEWLKTYLNYGRSSLLRTDLPSVSFLQKSSSSPVSCHATGFYPNRAEMFWRKDGEEVHGGVVKGEILPNNDGTFQMSVDIDLSSVVTRDWNKYECVFQLSGVNEEIVHRLERTRIRSNEYSPLNMIIPVVVALAVLCLIGVIGFIIYKKKNAKRPPSPVDNSRPPEKTKFLPEA